MNYTYILTFDPMVGKSILANLNFLSVSYMDRLILLKFKQLNGKENFLPVYCKNKNHGRHIHGFFARSVHLTYALVGTGETYFAALAALNLLVNLETFLEAACFEIVFLAAACMNFFSTRRSFS